jgi:RimJ/RimL family protein N-acetyltransferase
MAGPAYRVETRRLVMRCWRPQDIDLADEAALVSLEHLRPWMAWARDEPRPRAESVDLLRELRGKFDLGESFFYAILDADERRILGGIGLHLRQGPDTRELGYWIRVDEINKGLATEAAAALTRVALEIDEVGRVVIRCEVANLRSARIPAKLGFTHEATLRRAGVSADGSPCDEMLWTLLREEFAASPAWQLSVDAAAYDAIGRRLL